MTDSIRTLQPTGHFIYFVIFVVCAILVVAALVMQYAFSMEPCPLCITQRAFIILAGLIALTAALHNTGRVGNRIYACLGAISTLAGAAVAARHVWLQNLPEDQVPICGPDIAYLFEALPFWEAMSRLFAGDGNCAEASWRFLGLTIPAWTLLCFVTLTLTFFWQLFRQHRSTSG